MPMDTAAFNDLIRRTCRTLERTDESEYASTVERFVEEWFANADIPGVLMFASTMAENVCGGLRAFAAAATARATDAEWVERVLRRHQGGAGEEHDENEGERRASEVQDPSKEAGDAEGDGGDQQDPAADVLGLAGADGDGFPASDDGADQAALQPPDAQNPAGGPGQDVKTEPEDDYEAPEVQAAEADKEVKKEIKKEEIDDEDPHVRGAQEKTTPDDEEAPSGAAVDANGDEVEAAQNPSGGPEDAPPASDEVLRRRDLPNPAGGAAKDRPASDSDADDEDSEKGAEEDEEMTQEDEEEQEMSDEEDDVEEDPIGAMELEMAAEDEVDEALEAPGTDEGKKNEKMATDDDEESDGPADDAEESESQERDDEEMAAEEKDDPDALGVQEDDEEQEMAADANVQEAREEPGPDEEEEVEEHVVATHRGGAPGAQGVQDDQEEQEMSDEEDEVDEDPFDADDDETEAPEAQKAGEDVANDEIVTASESLELADEAEDKEKLEHLKNLMARTCETFSAINESEYDAAVERLFEEWTSFMVLPQVVRMTSGLARAAQKKAKPGCAGLRAFAAAVVAKAAEAGVDVDQLAPFVADEGDSSGGAVGDALVDAAGADQSQSALGGVDQRAADREESESRDGFEEDEEEQEMAVGGKRLNDDTPVDHARTALRLLGDEEDGRASSKSFSSPSSRDETMEVQDPQDADVDYPNDVDAAQEATEDALDADGLEDDPAPADKNSSEAGVAQVLIRDGAARGRSISSSRDGMEVVDCEDAPDPEAINAQEEDNDVGEAGDPDHPAGDLDEVEPAVGGNAIDNDAVAAPGRAAPAVADDDAAPRPVSKRRKCKAVPVHSGRNGDVIAAPSKADYADDDVDGAQSVPDPARTNNDDAAPRSAAKKRRSNDVPINSGSNDDDIAAPALAALALDNGDDGAPITSQRVAAKRRKSDAAAAIDGNDAPEMAHKAAAKRKKSNAAGTSKEAAPGAADNSATAAAAAKLKKSNAACQCNGTAPPIADNESGSVAAAPKTATKRMMLNAAGSSNGTVTAADADATELLPKADAQRKKSNPARSSSGTASPIADDDSGAAATKRKKVNAAGTSKAAAADANDEPDNDTPKRTKSNGVGSSNGTARAVADDESTAAAKRKKSNAPGTSQATAASSDYFEASMEVIMRRIEALSTPAAPLITQEAGKRDSASAGAGQVAPQAVAKRRKSNAGSATASTSRANTGRNHGQARSSSSRRTQIKTNLANYSVTTAEDAEFESERAQRNDLYDAEPESAAGKAVIVQVSEILEEQPKLVFFDYCAYNLIPIRLLFRQNDDLWNRLDRLLPLLQKQCPREVEKAKREAEKDDDQDFFRFLLLVTFFNQHSDDASLKRYSRIYRRFPGGMTPEDVLDELVDEEDGHPQICKIDSSPPQYFLSLNDCAVVIKSGGLRVAMLAIICVTNLFNANFNSDVADLCYYFWTGLGHKYEKAKCNNAVELAHKKLGNRIKSRV